MNRATRTIETALRLWPGFNQPMPTINFEAMASEIVRSLWQDGHIICDFNSAHVWRDLRDKNYPDYDVLAKWAEKKMTCNPSQ